MTAIESIVALILKEAAKRLAKKAGEDEPDAGRFAGRYLLEPTGRTDQGRAAYTFTNDSFDPFRFCHLSGYEFMPPVTYDTDLCSIPRLARLIPAGVIRTDPAAFTEQGIFHDGLCRLGWCWVRRAGDTAWRKMRVSRKQADVMFHWFMSAPTLSSPPKQATRLECVAYYRAVRVGATVAGALTEEGKKYRIDLRERSHGK